MNRVLSMFLASCAALTPLCAGAGTLILQPVLTVGQSFREAMTFRDELPGVGPRVMRGSITVRDVRAESAGDLLSLAMNFAGKNVTAEAIVNPVTMQVTDVNGSASSPRTVAATGISMMYDPLFWGMAPTILSEGSAWSYRLAGPWTYGPAGVEAVRIVSLNPAAGTVQLALSGQGVGPSATEQEHPVISTGRMNGRVVNIPVTFGTTTWQATLTLVNGITQDERIVVSQEWLYGQTEISPARQEVRRSTITLHRLS